MFDVLDKFWGGMCPGGRPGLQNQWQVANGRLRWVRLPSLPANYDNFMEISLFQNDEPLHVERLVLYPYPDLKRIWTRIWLNAVQDKQPNLEIRLLNPDGSENSSLFMMAQTDTRIETTLHVRNPHPGLTYRVVAELSEGIGDQMQLLEHKEFDLTLEFRNPDAGDAGFGFGVDWDEVRRKQQKL